MKRLVAICTIMLIVNGCSVIEHSIPYDYYAVCEQIAIGWHADTPKDELFKEPLEFRSSLMIWKRRQFDRDFSDALAISVITQSLLITLERAQMIGDFSPTMISGMLEHELSIVNILPDVFIKPYISALNARILPATNDDHPDKEIHAIACTMLDQPDNASLIIESIDKDVYSQLAQELIYCCAEKTKDVFDDFSVCFFANILTTQIHKLQTTQAGVDFSSYLQVPLINYLNHE